MNSVAELTAPQRHAMLTSLDRAPTLLENLFWGWLLGYSSSAAYLKELEATPLDDGPGDEPDDFEGEP